MYDHRIGYVYKIQGQLGFLPNLKATLVASCLIYLSCVSFLPVLTNPPLFLNDDHDALSVCRVEEVQRPRGSVAPAAHEPFSFYDDVPWKCFSFFFFFLLLKMPFVELHSSRYEEPSAVALPSRERKRKEITKTHTHKSANSASSVKQFKVDNLLTAVTPTTEGAWWCWFPCASHPPPPPPPSSCLPALPGARGADFRGRDFHSHLLVARCSPLRALTYYCARCSSTVGVQQTLSSLGVFVSESEHALFLQLLRCAFWQQQQQHSRVCKRNKKKNEKWNCGSGWEWQGSGGTVSFDDAGSASSSSSSAGSLLSFRHYSPADTTTAAASGRSAGRNVCATFAHSKH